MTNNSKRAIIEEMRALGFFEYGTVVECKRYREFFGIVYPESGTKKEFDTLQLEELSHIDFIRNQLLNEGKYIKRDGECYRILLPSENESQVRSYMENADGKLKKAIKLAKNTPKVAYENSYNDVIRAQLKLTKNNANIHKPK